MEDNADLPPPFNASENAPPSYEPAGRGVSVSFPRPLTELVYTLDTSKGKPWALLKVYSHASKNAKVPAFMEREVITGKVELQLEKIEHIQTVTVAAVGAYTTVGQDSMPFLSKEQTVWSSATDEPRTPKLKGDYVWPFSIELPNTVMASSFPKGPLSEHPLPPTFSERASPFYLEYKIVVTFRRGKFRIDNVLSTSFAYQRCTRPDPPSELRQLAYRQNSAPPGPKPDPEGWENLGGKSVVGTIFDNRQVEVTCQFYLAKPLAYAKGAFIPFYLVLGCSDEQTLNLFAARGSLEILLFRVVSIGSEANSGTSKTASHNTNKNFTDPVAKGIYWPAEDNNIHSDVRRLEGEIPLKADLKSSFSFPNISIKYQVSFVLTAPGFTMVEGSAPQTHTREINIASLPTKGIESRSRVSQMSSGGDAEGKLNYEVSIAMLTAANQRFLHHHR